MLDACVITGAGRTPPVLAAFISIVDCVFGAERGEQRAEELEKSGNGAKIGSQDGLEMILAYFVGCLHV
jgi:hypothetical protein